MTRAEQLALWRQGYDAGFAAGARQRHDHDLAVHQAEVNEFRAQRRDDQIGARNALLLEVIDVLARAMLGESAREDHAA